MSIKREIRRRWMIEDMKESGMRTRCRKCGARMSAKDENGWVCEKCGWESEKHEQIRRELEEATRGDHKGRGKEVDGLEYGLTGNVLYVNDSRIVYPEYLPKYEMTPIHLSVSNELIS